MVKVLEFFLQEIKDSFSSIPSDKGEGLRIPGVIAYGDVEERRRELASYDFVSDIYRFRNL
jgi:hypothetical protein